MVTLSSTFLVLFFGGFFLFCLFFGSGIIRAEKKIKDLFEAHRRLCRLCEQRNDSLFESVENLQGDLNHLEQSIKPVKPLIHTSDNTLKDFDITQASYEGDPYS